MNNNLNEKSIIRICANCNCFGHPKPETLWKSCPNSSPATDGEFIVLNVNAQKRYEMYPIWITDSFDGKALLEIHGESILEQFRSHMAFCKILKRLRVPYEETEEEYLVDAILEYYSCINDLLELKDTLLTRKDIIEDVEYKILYTTTMFKVKSLYQVNFPSTISREYYNNSGTVKDPNSLKSLKYTSNPFVWFHIKCLGVLIAKDIQQNQFFLPDVPELSFLKPMLNPENLLYLLEEKSKKDLNKLKTFKWTNPVNGALWDFTKTPWIYPKTGPHLFLNNNVSQNELKIIVDTLPQNYDYMYRDLYIKFALSPTTFYQEHGKILCQLPQNFICRPLVIDITKDQKITQKGLLHEISKTGNKTE